ncbi:hypothetical protein GWK47_027897 [Chionoecetes opilio]|uniref:Uncharacterized protein n=1 Tax=Chionoecetes opilio TaxID=41210 RepID=A0A8J8WL11_CHIOP|nr:hypothetical protein GWK47_027897 [Chionoecetes opilio]
MYRGASCKRLQDIPFWRPEGAFWRRVRAPPPQGRSSAPPHFELHPYLRGVTFRIWRWRRRCPWYTLTPRATVLQAWRDTGASAWGSLCWGDLGISNVSSRLHHGAPTLPGQQRPLGASPSGLRGDAPPQSDLIPKAQNSTHAQGMQGPSPRAHTFPRPPPPTSVVCGAPDPHKPRARKRHLTNCRGNVIARNGFFWSLRRTVFLWGTTRTKMRGFSPHHVHLRPKKRPPQSTSQPPRSTSLTRYTTVGATS